MQREVAAGAEIPKVATATFYSKQVSDSAGRVAHATCSPLCGHGPDGNLAWLDGAKSEQASRWSERTRVAESGRDGKA